MFAINILVCTSVRSLNIEISINVESRYSFSPLECMKFPHWIGFCASSMSNGSKWILLSWTNSMAMTCSFYFQGFTIKIVNQISSSLQWTTTTKNLQNYSDSVFCLLDIVIEIYWSMKFIECALWCGPPDVNATTTYSTQHNNT